MAVYGLKANDSLQKLCDAFTSCLKVWGSDPAYADYAFQIDQALRGLCLLAASPGMKAAASMPAPNMSGQTPRGFKPVPGAVVFNTAGQDPAPATHS